MYNSNIMENETDTTKSINVNFFVKKTKKVNTVSLAKSDEVPLAKPEVPLAKPKVPLAKPEVPLAKPDKPKKKRIITGNDRIWNQTDIESLDESQLIEILKYLLLTKDSSTKDSSKSPVISKLIINQIANKISSYKSQDIEKGIFDPEKFIHLEAVIQKIVDSGLKCFYCRESMRLLYEYVREPKQWTVERLDNKRGHNCDNIEIACLTCNLRRRTMYHERYIFTKQVKIVKETVVK